MACGSSCCGPGDVPARAEPPTDDTCFGPNVTDRGARNPDEPAKDGCPDACCDGPDKKDSDGTIAGDLCGSGPAKDGCPDACCDGPDKKASDGTVAGDVCGSGSVDGDCQQDCCGSDTRARDEATVGRPQQGCCSGPKGNPSCGKDKTSSPDISKDRYIPGGGCSKAKAQKPRQQTEASCCEINAEKEAHCTKPAESTSPGGCCPAPAASENTDGNSSCCGDKASPSAPAPAEADCNKGCCSEPTAPTTPTTEDPRSPSCCKDKVSPCCDVSCLDRIALRECDVSSDAITLGRCSVRKEGKPCASHTRAARDKYAATLSAIGCICRALLALGQESCCPPRKRTSVERKRCGRKSPSPRVSVDSCCAAGSCAGPRVAKPVSLSGKRAKGSCADGCCSKKPTNITEKTREISSETIAADPEKGFAGKERTILSISGMTCTGCETKLQRSLATVPSVSRLKTSLVLARAEFDVDLSLGSVADVIKHLERTTEFKCERVSNQGATLDLVVPGDPAEFSEGGWPPGVTDVTVVDKKTVRVAFDAKIIGARDLVEKGWETPVTLAAPRADPTLEAGGKHVRHVGYMTLLSAILTIPVLVLSWAPLPERKIAYSSACMALATLVQVLIAGPFYPTALKSLVFSRMIEMDLLIVLSTSAAYIFSVVSFGYLVAGQPLSTGEFFETSTLLVTLIMVGRYVGALARQKAVESISIRSLQTSTATLVDGEAETEIDSRLLQYGDIFKVVPDSRIPTDGTVISGSSEVDESMLTGESKPVEKYPKAPVIAGSINGSGTIVVRLTRLPGDNTISTIAGMVDEAKLSKPRIQDIADRVASYFVPVVVCLTVITFCVWIAVGVAVRKQSGSDAATEAITYAITVLIVSCPCAIGLAVPMVVVIASGVAAERGIIFKSADSIEVAYKTSHVVFDKTVTLTRGKLTVVAEEYVAADEDRTKALLLGLVGGIKHPVSAAVASHLRESGVSGLPISDIKALPAKGVEGTVQGQVLRAGNARWLGLSTDERVQSMQLQGYTTLCFTVNGSLAAIFGLTDSLRPDALSTVQKLQGAGIAVHIVSGDDSGAVASVSTQLGVPSPNVRSRATPEDKKSYIESLLSAVPTPSRLPFLKAKPKAPVVMFVGDGTNDAVALAQSTIGVHINEGTDVAQSAADVVLMRPSLSGVLGLIKVSRMSVRRIAFNFGWSFVYNLFAVLLAAGAFVGARIPPEFAGLGEVVSVLPVVAAAVLLRWARI